MPSIKRKTIEIQKTNTNLKNNELLDAVVLANYGDPGIEEDAHADILSRYVICVIESANRILTPEKWINQIVVVKRPEHLWIKYLGGYLNNPDSQKKIDVNLNINVGKAGSYVTDTIPKINFPYKLGEKIKIKLVEQDSLFNESSFFNSECKDISEPDYKNWHAEGENLISDEKVKKTIKTKTIARSSDYKYNFTFTKGQYEALIYSLYGKEEVDWVFVDLLYNKHGGYLFADILQSETISLVEYQDINVGGKARIPTNACIPVVVTSPNTFTVPKTRAIGTVNYSPTYIEVKNESNNVTLPEE